MTTRGGVTLETLADYVEGHVATKAQLQEVETRLTEKIESVRDEAATKRQVEELEEEVKNIWHRLDDLATKEDVQEVRNALSRLENAVTEVLQRL